MSEAAIVFGGYTAADLEAQYNLRARRPDADAIMAQWAQRSAAACERLNPRRDVAYGDGARQRIDVFRTSRADAPGLIYFHGGYWQRGDKALYSFLAEPFVLNGAAVIVVGYDLCPDVSITRIAEEARAALAWIWRNAGDLGVDRDRLTVMGHSAGGHITAMMMGTDFSTMGPDLPKHVARAGALISPVVELEPLRFTSLNDLARLDAEEALRESPIHHPPVTNAPQLVAVGARETDEFHRQAQLYAERFRTGERSMELFIAPDVDHFDILNLLAREDSAFFAKTMRMVAA